MTRRALGHEEKMTWSSEEFGRGPLGCRIAVALGHPGMRAGLLQGCAYEPRTHRSCRTTTTIPKYNSVGSATRRYQLHVWQSLIFSFSVRSVHVVLSQHASILRTAVFLCVFSAELLLLRNDVGQ